MKKFFLSTLSFILLFSLPSFIVVSFASPPSTASVSPNAATLARLTQLLGNLQTMQANFSQVTVSANGERTRTSGQMAIVRPGKFRWAVQKPNKQLFVADGQYLWIYDQDLAQVTKQKLQANKSGNPAALLSSSLTNLQQQFYVTQLKPYNQMIAFQLKPKSGESMFKWVNLYFKNNQLASMSMLNNLDQTSTFNFSHVKFNNAVDLSLFRFKAPKGTDVIQN